MCPQVLYNGEWVDKNYLKSYLDKQANDPEYQRKLKEEEEERKKQKRQEQKQKRIETQSKEEKIHAYIQKYRQEFPGEWSDEMTQKMLERANNAYNYHLQYEKDRKDQEEWLKQSEAQHKKWEEERKKQQEEFRKLPEIQINRIISGDYLKPVNATLSIRHIKHGLTLLKQEYDTGKIIRLDEQTHKKVVEFAKPDEPILDVINRLLDIAEAKASQY